MKTYFPVAIVLLAFASCSQVGRQIDEAREAQKKRDSILKAFKEVNDQLQKTQDSLGWLYDSSYKTPDDTSLRR